MIAVPGTAAVSGGRHFPSGDCLYSGEFMVTHGLEVTEGELEPGDLIFILMSRMGSSAIFPMWQFMLVMAEWYMQPTADVG